MLYGVNESFFFPLLLSRPVVKAASAENVEITGRTVVVTGAGGSIGSEIVRQVLMLKPAKLVMIDHSELNLYEINMTVASSEVHVERVPLLCDIRDQETMLSIFVEHKPSLLIHAAALKHVPLLENDHNLIQAVMTNAVAVHYIATLCATTDCQMLLISTDKAVRPSSAMGLTKRVGELALALAGHHKGRQFRVVRFGNVLGSSGSVIPLFLRQIAQGGPVTVTHPDMKRFFMTIGEAVSLSLYSLTIKSKSITPTVSILEMGKQVLIVDLAKQLIEMAGRRFPDDIDIVFTGIRPGEKIKEELYYADEKPVFDEKSGIATCQLGVPEDQDLLFRRLQTLAQERNPERVKAALKLIEPSYTGDSTWM